jgi:hypothetical protein
MIPGMVIGNGIETMAGVVSHEGSKRGNIGNEIG